MLKGSKGECKIQSSPATAKHLCPAPNSHDNVFPSSVLLGCRAPPNPDHIADFAWNAIGSGLSHYFPPIMSDILDPSDTFATLCTTVGLDVRLRKALSRLGYVRPTLVQSRSLPLAHVRPRSAGPSSDRQRQDSGLLPSIVAQDFVAQVW